jgi:hypothetical protein
VPDPAKFTISQAHWQLGTTWERFLKRLWRMFDSEHALDHTLWIAVVSQNDLRWPTLEAQLYLPRLADRVSAAPNLDRSVARPITGELLTHVVDVGFCDLSEMSVRNEIATLADEPEVIAHPHLRRLRSGRRFLTSVPIMSEEDGSSCAA